MEVCCPKCKSVLIAGEIGPSNGYRCTCGFAFWVDDNGRVNPVQQKRRNSFSNSLANAIGVLLLVFVIMGVKKWISPWIREGAKDGFSTVRLQQKDVFSELEEHALAYNKAIEETGVVSLFGRLNGLSAPLNPTQRLNTITILDKAIPVIESQEMWMRQFSEKLKASKSPCSVNPELEQYCASYHKMLIAQVVYCYDLICFYVSSHVLSLDDQVEKETFLKKYNLTITRATAYAIGSKHQQQLEQDFSNVISLENEVIDLSKKFKGKE